MIPLPLSDQLIELGQEHARQAERERLTAAHDLATAELRMQLRAAEDDRDAWKARAEALAAELAPFLAARREREMDL